MPDGSGDEVDEGDRKNMETSMFFLGFPVPGVHVHLYICRKMSTLLKAVRVRKDPFPVIN